MSHPRPVDPIRSAGHWRHVGYAVVLTTVTVVTGPLTLFAGTSPPSPVTTLALGITVAMATIGLLAAVADLPGRAAAMVAGVRELPPDGEGITDLCRSAGIDADVAVFDACAHQNAWVVGRADRTGTHRLYVSDRLRSRFSDRQATALLVAVAARTDGRYRLVSLFRYYVAPIEILGVTYLAIRLREAGVVGPANVLLVVVAGIGAGAVVTVLARSYARRIVFEADDRAAAATDPRTTAVAIERAAADRTRLREFLAPRPAAGTRATRLRARTRSRGDDASTGSHSARAD